MRTVITTIAIGLITLASQPLNAQERIQHFSFETEPVAYILGGADITGSYQYGS